MSFLDTMKQLTEIKQKMDEVKNKLDNQEIRAENEVAVIIATGSRKIKSVELKLAAAALPASQTNELLKKLINEVLEKSDAATQTEMGAVTKGLIPGM